MKKTLYLMRHGQTLFNSLKKIQGACDSPLTEVGIAQAKIAKQYFVENGITFDAAYSSTQERASDTLELVTDQPYTRLKGIKEWNFGRFEGESEALNPKRQPGRTSFYDAFVAYGGEHVDDVQVRMNATLREIMEQDANESVLALSHGGACFSFFLTRNVWQDLGDRTFANCCILKYEYEAGEFTFIEMINHDFSHL